MAYKKTNWKDHVVERPRTYTEKANTDGTKTFTPSPGEVLQEGTPQSATNFNNFEEALLHYSIATDALLNQNEQLLMEIQTIKEQLAALTVGSN